MNVYKKSGEYHFEDKSKKIDCVYRDGKFVGSGSRKYKDLLREEFDSLVTQEIIETLNTDNPTKEQLEEAEAMVSSYSDTISNIWNGLNMPKVFDTVDKKTLHNYQKNPSKFNPQLRALSMYWYGQKGVLNKSYDLLKNMHTLRSSLNYFNPLKENIDQLKLDVKKFDTSLFKKEDIRNIIFQAVAEGTCLGYVRGRKLEEKYIQILDLEYYVSKSKSNGVWQIEVDLYKFSSTGKNSEKLPNDHMLTEKEMLPNAELNSQPLEVRRAYYRMVSRADILRKNNNKMTKSIRYYKLNVSKTFVIRNMAKDDEYVGRPYGLPAFDDLLHKELIRASETALIDRLINIALIVQMGETGEKGYKTTDAGRKTLAREIKRAITDNNITGLKLIGIPYWAEIKQLELDYDLFNKDKYEAIDDDIAISLGVQGIFGGDKSNSFANADLALNLLFTNIFNLLEQIETRLFNYQYNKVIKPDDIDVIITREFIRTTDLDNNIIVDTYRAMIDKGGSIKKYFDSIGDIDFEDYIAHTKVEQEDMELRDLLIPYLNSYTTTQEDVIKDNDPVDNNQKDNGNSQAKPSTK